MAFALAETIGLPSKTLNAVTDKKKDMEIVVEQAKMQGQTVLILDEVHRLDKAKQDFLLPHLENNLLTLIGCTTSNPYHSINPAIRSRCHLFELHGLTLDNVKTALQRAIQDTTNGYGDKNIQISPDAMEHLAISANGDLRSALNGLELAVSSTPPNANDQIQITLEIAEECMQKKAFPMTKTGMLITMY